MKALGLALAALALGPSCATSWVGVQAAGIQPMLDEGVREVSVPQPELAERLRVTLPMPAFGGAPSVRCTVEQVGSDAVYHAAFRYGRNWKIATATMFLLEAGAAAALMLTADELTPQVVGGLLAVDALGTAALFFAPRKEIYRRDLKPHQAYVRGDCPAGLMLTIDGQAYAVDPDGGLGEVGIAALDAWMEAGAGALQADFDGQVRDLVVMAASRCRWKELRTTTTVPGCVRSAAGDATQVASATLPVAVGRLTGMPALPAETEAGAEAEAEAATEAGAP